ncbi:hypothetical protein L202_04772 [Cryptococcus amylolentus CBS 6039]|uniref:Mtf2-like C-terminal domain-containing protein n=2 Tax=Cryptococcus amylolentus TaxID=104669 RepID=A0A1E3HMP8_9TREE|nr:hypothetical protein L202_04772 [Cryptococcus amylolentus CBS 6039]ODN77608.1 hypothetical protein L202_04772 [Cryptococcus amylolentus CBS 6039]
MLTTQSFAELRLLSVRTASTSSGSQRRLRSFPASPSKWGRRYNSGQGSKPEAEEPHEDRSPRGEAGEAEQPSNLTGQERRAGMESETAGGHLSVDTKEPSPRATTFATSEAQPAHQSKAFNEILKTLYQEGSKQPSNPSPSSTSRTESIISKLRINLSSAPRPREFRGTRSRSHRSAGMSPHESSKFTEAIMSILDTFPKGTEGAGGGGGVGGSRGGDDAFSATHSGGSGFGLGKDRSRGTGFSPFRSGAGQDSLRNVVGFSGRSQSEDELIEEYEILAEQINVIQTDVELVEWAKEHVFKAQAVPEPQIASESSKSLGEATGEIEATASDTHDLPPLLQFSPVYPKILARTLEVLRKNFNSPHLLLALFHHAQTSSLESYLSGCGTAAYNQVLLCRWESFRDLEGVTRGVREMGMMGVKWDRETNRLVGRVVDEVGREMLEEGQGSRWGKKEDVLIMLQQLEERVEKDILDEEKRRDYELKMKRRDRERKEAEATREATRQAREEADVWV